MEYVCASFHLTNMAHRQVSAAYGAEVQRMLEGIACMPLIGHPILGYYDSALWHNLGWSHRTYRGSSELP
jgi:hypothetical protein